MFAARPDTVFVEDLHKSFQGLQSCQLALDGVRDAFVSGVLAFVRSEDLELESRSSQARTLPW